MGSMPLRAALVCIEISTLAFFWKMSESAAFWAPAAPEPSSATSSTIFLPRIPPAALISSAASCADCTTDGATGIFEVIWRAAVAFPWPALTQKDLPLVAVLVPGTADLARQRIDAVRKGLQEAGLAECRQLCVRTALCRWCLRSAAGARLGVGRTEAARHRRVGGRGHCRSLGRSRIANGLHLVCL